LTGSRWIAVFCSFLIFAGCHKSRKESRKNFLLIDPQTAGVDFVNQLKPTESFNTYTFRNFYNGAGVGLGDINNDGLIDIYFCGNTQRNELYLNIGDFKFQNITTKAGVGCERVWSTGVCVVDVNADGWLDIYVSKSGPLEGSNRHNELFINNGDLTFSEQSEKYGLNVTGLSVQAAFFDYDRDGDLDCYLLNNSIRSVENFLPREGLRKVPDPDGANLLLRNDEMQFIDVTSEAGIYNSNIGFGLGVAIADINRDNWPDLYISNDFFERDYLYINCRDGTFKESLVEQINEISMGAMGADIADINNDGYVDIYVTEMTPEDHARQKTKTVFQSWSNYQKNYLQGYYHQFPRNTLQVNNRNNSFSEIGRYAGVHFTDWSWGALIFDMDHDGYKDIFVANGIPKDLLDRDYLEFYVNPRNVQNLLSESDTGIISLIDKIPSEKVSNYAFINNQNLGFENQSESFGLSTPSFSNGSAYGDLDNDGDLDLVVNNINMRPFIFRNDCMKQITSNFITINLKGGGKNRQAIGAKATIYCKGDVFFQELFPFRGFMSTVDGRLNFGVGKHAIIDSLEITWPDGTFTIMKNLSANQFLSFDQRTADKDDRYVAETSPKTLLVSVSNEKLPRPKHKENPFSDFDRHQLLFHMRSNEGPKVCVGDINNDGLDDFYVCGAKDYAGQLFVQNDTGFASSNQSLLEYEKLSEETDCVFFDADNDGDQDLYVASGSLEYPSSSSALIDKLYINDGNGSFTKSKQILPSFIFESTSCVRPADLDLDGDLDLFVGSRLKPFSYGIAPQSYILLNDGRGNFTDNTSSIAQHLNKLGHVTDASWSDVDLYGDNDLVIVGEWMPITLLINENGKLQLPIDSTGLEKSHGWWKAIKSVDLDNDGDIDFIVGNHGSNSILKADKGHPIKMYVNDFDRNGSIEQIITTFQQDAYYPLAMKSDLIKQIPSLSLKIPTFERYKNMTLDSIFDQNSIARSIRYLSYKMESSVLINLGNGRFELASLPQSAQFSPVHAILIKDFNRDGLMDVILGGNQLKAKPEVGIYNASYGLLLEGIGNRQFKTLAPHESGINICGEVRDFEILRFQGEEILLVARNNEEIEYFKALN
jgi:hypothetical protein